MLAGYSAKAGHFSNILSDLRRAGLISEDLPLRITGAGLARLGPDWEPLPQGPELIGYWMGQLGKAEREVLQALLDAYPGSLTRQQVAERTETGYSVNAGHYGNALSRLRGLQLIEGEGRNPLRVDETLGAAAKARVGA